MTPLSATVLILTLSPASAAASMPSMTWAKRPQRVMRANFAGSSVSSETLTRLTPQSASSAAKRRSWLPLVVRVSSLSAPVARWRDMARKKVMIPLRTRGSPPVMRSFSHPEADEGRAEAVELLERQELGLGQELHVLGHAVDAAEVAAVRHRDPQIGDRARERVDQTWLLGQGGVSP